MGLEEYLASAGSLQPAFSTSTTKLSNFFAAFFSRTPTVRHPLNAQYTVLYERWSHVYITYTLTCERTILQIDIRVGVYYISDIYM